VEVTVEGRSTAQQGRAGEERVSRMCWALDQCMNGSAQHSTQHNTANVKLANCEVVQQHCSRSTTSLGAVLLYLLLGQLHNNTTLLLTVPFSHPSQPSVCRLTPRPPSNTPPPHSLLHQPCGCDPHGRI
jgi:hypothetical protein